MYFILVVTVLFVGIGLGLKKTAAEGQSHSPINKVLSRHAIHAKAEIEFLLPSTFRQVYHDATTL